MGIVMVKGRRKKGFCTLLLNCGKFYGCFFLKRGGLPAVLQHRVKLFIKSKLKFRVPNNLKTNHDMDIWLQLAWKRSVTLISLINVGPALTDFEKFHPPQNKNPLSTFIDFLEFSYFHPPLLIY